MKLSVTLISAMILIAPQAASASADLAKSKNCLACHQMEKKAVGPAFKDISKKYAGQNTAEAKLVDKVLKGGSGVWGTMPMPANTQVSKTEASTLVKWILSIK